MLGRYLLHLVFDGSAAAGGYYLRTWCRHRWHRVALTIAWSLLTTAGLVYLIG